MIHPLRRTALLFCINIAHAAASSDDSPTSELDPTPQLWPSFFRSPRRLQDHCFTYNEQAENSYAREGFGERLFRWWEGYEMRDPDNAHRNQDFEELEFPEEGGRSKSYHRGGVIVPADPSAFDASERDSFFLKSLNETVTCWDKRAATGNARGEWKEYPSMLWQVVFKYKWSTRHPLLNFEKAVDVVLPHRDWLEGHLKDPENFVRENLAGYLHALGQMPRCTLWRLGRVTFLGVGRGFCCWNGWNNVFSSVLHHNANSFEEYAKKISVFVPAIGEKCGSIWLTGSGEGEGLALWPVAKTVMAEKILRRCLSTITHASPPTESTGPPPRSIRPPRGKPTLKPELRSTTTAPFSRPSSSSKTLRSTGPCSSSSVVSCSRGTIWKVCSSFRERPARF